MRDLGDRTEDSTIDFTFHTTNTSGVPTTLSGTPAVSVYKANGITQSTAGVTLTADFDGVTGLNHVRIDTSADVFYATANDYSVVITTGTVGGTSVVGATVATFSIENRYTRGTDNAALASVVGALADSAAAGDPTAVDTIMQYVKQLVNILVGTDGVATFPAAAVPGNAVSLAEVIRQVYDEVAGLDGAAMRGTDSAALASVCTEARLAELDAANLPADIDNILTDTGTTLPLSLPAALTKGTADSGTDTTMVDAALTEADTDYWEGSWIRFTSGNIAGQTRLITGFTPASDTITFAPATTQAVGTNTYEILPAAGTAIDWGAVLRPTTAVDLSATDIQLCDTITTYTGNTVQTGDSFARLGAPAGASVSADIADIPTVSEFNARTLVAADYFDPAADTVANVTTVGSVTTKTGYELAATGLDLVIPTEPAGVLTMGTDTIVEWIGFFAALSVNEINSDADSINVRNNADSADLWVHSTSDNGTTFSSGAAT